MARGREPRARAMGLFNIYTYILKIVILYILYMGAPCAADPRAYGARGAGGAEPLAAFMQRGSSESSGLREERRRLFREAVPREGCCSAAGDATQPILMDFRRPILMDFRRPTLMK